MSDYTTHPDWLALVAAIRGAPDDDLPRLVAADWLEEHGEAGRAEFVRVQVAIATAVRERRAIPKGSQARERVLFDGSGGRWSDGLPDGWSAALPFESEGGRRSPRLLPPGVHRPGGVPAGRLDRQRVRAV